MGDGQGRQSGVVFRMVQGQITVTSESWDCRFENVAHKQDGKGKEEAEPWERQYMELLQMPVLAWGIERLSAGTVEMMQCPPKAA